MEITAEILSTAPISDIMQTVTIRVSKDGTFSHDKELDVRVAAYQSDIKAYLSTFKAAEEARELISEGEIITL